MTKEDIVLKDKEREEKALTYHSAIIESVKGMNKNMRVMIISARAVRENHLFVELGYESFNAYLSSPEISVKPATMEKYIKLYEETVGKEKITNAEFEKIPISKMELIAPLKNPQGWVESAKTLSYSDLRKKIFEKVYGVKADDVDSYDKKVSYETQFCPHWDIKECRCCAGVDINKPIIAQPSKKAETEFKGSLLKDKDKKKSRDLI